MEVLGKLSDLIFINCTFVLLSLPVFTIGASMAAMYECCFSLIEDTEDPFLPRQFWKAFVRNFKRGTGSWGISLLFILFLGAYALVSGMFTGTLGQMYRITFFVLLFLFLMGFQYVFPLLAHSDSKVLQVWKDSWKMAVTALPWTALNLVIILGSTAVCTLLLPANMAVYLWAFLFFALIAFLSSFIIRHVFKKFGVYQ